MSDQPAQTPDQQVVTPDQQAPGTPDPADGIDYKARYTGQQLALQRLATENKDLQAQLAARTSELEQLRAQLSLKDTEKTVAVGERDKQLQTALQESATLRAELEKLRALQLKVKVINDLKRPELLRLADRLPDLTDEESLKVVIQDFASFADDLVLTREKQLLAGVTGAGSGSITPTTTLPTSDKGWEEYIDKFELGTPERKKAMDDYGDFLWRQNSPQR